MGSFLATMRTSVLYCTRYLSSLTQFKFAPKISNEILDGNLIIANDDQVETENRISPLPPKLRVKVFDHRDVVEQFRPPKVCRQWQDFIIANDDQGETENRISRLPPEILMEIFNHLDVMGKFRSSKVCRQWRDLIAFPEESLLKLRNVFETYPNDILWPLAGGGDMHDSNRRMMEDLFSQSDGNLLYVEKHGHLIIRNSFFSDQALSTFVFWFSHLKEVELSNCANVTDEGIRALANLRLQSLVLYSCCNLTDEALLHLSKSRTVQKSLHSLSLFNNDLMIDDGLAHVATLEGLAYLLIGPPFGNLAMELLTEGHTRIKNLDITGCRNMSDEALFSVGRMERLRTLTLRQFSRWFTSFGLQLMAEEGSQISKLSLSDCVLTSEDAIQLARLRSLRLLFLQNVHLDHHFAEKLANGQSRLCYLHFWSHHSVGQEFMFHLSRLTELRKLAWYNGDPLSPGCFGNPVQGGSQIQCFSYGLVSDADAILLASLPSLRKLTVSGPEVTDHYLKCLADAKLNIECLVLSSCEMVTDVGISYVTKLPSLIKLGLWACLITESGLADIVDCIPQLQSLEVKFCFELGKQMLEIIAKRPNHCLHTLKLDRYCVSKRGLVMAGLNLHRLDHFEFESKNCMSSIKEIRNSQVEKPYTNLLSEVQLCTKKALHTFC